MFLSKPTGCPEGGMGGPLGGLNRRTNCLHEHHRRSSFSTVSPFSSPGGEPTPDLLPSLRRTGQRASYPLHRISRPCHHWLISRPYSDQSETAWDFVGLMNRSFSPGDGAIHRSSPPRIAVWTAVVVFQREDQCFARQREARTAVRPTRHPPEYRCRAASRPSIAGRPWHAFPQRFDQRAGVLTATSAQVRTRTGRIRSSEYENRTVCWTQPVHHYDSRRRLRRLPHSVFRLNLGDLGGLGGSSFRSVRAPGCGRIIQEETGLRSQPGTKKTTDTTF
jgi:hypothetical protein